MDELIAFVTARLDEDEAAARAYVNPGGELTHRHGTSEPGWREHNHAGGGVPHGHDPETGFQVPLAAECHDPARTLREVAAKRAILDRHMPHETAFDGLACNWCSDDVDDRPQIAKERWPCPDVRSLAAVWSDHADYRDEWATQAAPPPP